MKWWQQEKFNASIFIFITMFLLQMANPIICCLLIFFTTLFMWNQSKQLYIKYSNIENILKIPWQYVAWIISQLQGFISVSGSDNTVGSGGDSDWVQSCITSAAAIGYILYMCHSCYTQTALIAPWTSANIILIQLGQCTSDPNQYWWEWKDLFVY